MTLTRQELANKFSYLASRCAHQCASFGSEAPNICGNPDNSVRGDAVKDFVEMLRDTATELENMHNENR